MSSRICCSRYADDNHRQCQCGWQTSPFVTLFILFARFFSCKQWAYCLFIREGLVFLLTVTNFSPFQPILTVMNCRELLGALCWASVVIISASLSCLTICSVCNYQIQMTQWMVPVSLS